MTANSNNAKRSIWVPRGTTSRIRSASYTPPTLPSSPSVSEGPKSYGLTRKGWHLVPRFYISPYTYRAKRRESGKWIVVDMDEAKIARNTDKKGYPKKEAKRIAERFRDRYGAWSRVPF